MPEYLVNWHIEIDADTPEQAAAEALAIQRDPTSTATMFEVSWVEGARPGVRHTTTLEVDAST